MPQTDPQGLLHDAWHGRDVHAHHPVAGIADDQEWLGEADDRERLVLKHSREPSFGGIGEPPDELYLLVVVDTDLHAGVQRLAHPVARMADRTARFFDAAHEAFGAVVELGACHLRAQQQRRTVGPERPAIVVRQAGRAAAQLFHDGRGGGVDRRQDIGVDGAVEHAVDQLGEELLGVSNGLDRRRMFDHRVERPAPHVSLAIQLAVGSAGSATNPTS
jgi:hypothetical protein